MDINTIIRGKVLDALNDLKYNGILIPIFDEVVNPKVVIPKIENAETFVVIQDQQSSDSATQTVCAVRLTANITIKVVTTWKLSGSKKLCEDIGNLIDTKLRTLRNESKLSDVQEVKLSVSRTITEKSESNLAFSKIMIYSITINIED